MDILRGGWAPGLLGNGAGLRADSPSTGGYDAATDAIAAAFTTPPTTARKNLIDAAVVSLKSAGVWAKLDALYAFAAADSQAAKINWKAPGTFNATEVNAPTFTIDRGFTGASTKYVDTNFNPTTATTPKFVQDSSCMFAHTTSNLAVAGGLFGHSLNASISAYARYTDNNFYFRMNQGAVNLTAASTDSTGLWSATRSAAGASELFKNGVSVDTDAGASSIVPNANLLILVSVADYWTGQITCGGIAQHLNSTEQTALYNALRTYLTGVGVP